MNEQPSARKVLLAARSELARRLTELVLAAQEDVLADARGESYMNEIETLYEQVGIKLAHVNQMLAGLPADLEVESSSPPSPAQAPPASAPPASAKPAAEPAAELGLSPPSTSATNIPRPAAEAIETLAPFPPESPKPMRQPIALPRRNISGGLAVPRKESPLRPLISAPTSGQAPHLAIFAAQVRQGDLSAAGHTLSQMLGIEFPRAVACAAYFAEQLQEDPRLLLRIAQLQMELQASSFKGARLLLVECLGLTSEEAAHILYQSQPDNRSKSLGDSSSKQGTSSEDAT